MYYIDIPTKECATDSEGTWTNVVTCATKKAAVAWIREYIGACDEEGRIGLLTLGELTAAECQAELLDRNGESIHLAEIEANLDHYVERVRLLDVPASKRTYDVLVTANATVSTTVRVKASSPQEAERLALEVDPHMGGWDWQIDENVLEPYIADPGHCAEEVNGGEV